jgi:hypothetical protein
VSNAVMILSTFNSIYLTNMDYGEVNEKSMGYVRDDLIDEILLIDRERVRITLHSFSYATPQLWDIASECILIRMVNSNLLISGIKLE